MLRSGVMAASLSAGLAGCGTVLWSVDEFRGVPENLDGAILSYALAQGEVTFTATYSDEKKLFFLTSDQQVVGKPDYDHVHRIAYNHSGFSSDDIAVELSAGLLKKISSTTEDQSLAALQGVNAILTQVAATQTALEKASSKSVMQIVPPKEEAPPKCGDIRAQAVVNITHKRWQQSYSQIGDPSCTIRIDITKISDPVKTLSVKGFRESPADSPSEFNCDFAVCFRLGGVFDVQAVATLEQRHQDKVTIKETTPALGFRVLAPVKNAIGFVRFNRRAFVQNKTTITFDNAGIVSHFAATNPSEVVGMLKVPSELLKGVSAAIVIH